MILKFNFSRGIYQTELKTIKQT